MSPLHHFAKQFGEHRAWTSQVGIGQGRALRRPHPQVIKPGRMARQSGDDLAQAHRPRQLAVQQCNKLAFCVQAPNPRIGPVFVDQPLKHIPRYVLQDSMKNAILMAHGIDPPSRVRTVGKTSRTEWNQCHAPCPVKLNRTAVGQARPSTLSGMAVPASMDARIKSGHDG